MKIKLKIISYIIRILFVFAFFSLQAQDVPDILIKYHKYRKNDLLINNLDSIQKNRLLHKLLENKQFDTIQKVYGINLDSTLIFCDINNDSKIDIIFYGKIARERNVLDIYVNKGKSFVKVKNVIGNDLVSYKKDSTGFYFQVVTYPYCASKNYLLSDITIKNNAIDSAYILENIWFYCSNISTYPLKITKQDSIRVSKTTVLSPQPYKVSILDNNSINKITPIQKGVELVQIKNKETKEEWGFCKFNVVDTSSFIINSSLYVVGWLPKTNLVNMESSINNSTSIHKRKKEKP